MAVPVLRLPAALALGAPPPTDPTLVPLHPSLFPRQGDVWGVDGVRGSLLLSGVRQGCLSTGHFGAVQA